MRRVSGIATLFVLVSVAPAFAQSEGRVIVDMATIWRTDARVPAGVARIGTVLEITAQSGRWYEVVIPASLGGHGEHGLIAVSQVQLLPNSPAPPTRELAAPQETPPESRQPGGAAQPARRPRPSSDEPSVGVRGFVHAAYATFRAEKSFDAILGQSHGPLFGGGGQVRQRGIFAQVSIERFRKTGERVFIFENNVFPLGIADTITITPIVATVGYRFNRRQMIVPYAGAGIGSYRYQEESAFADPSENVDERHRGYHVMGGAEVRGGRWFAVGVDAQYAWVPDALGADAVSKAFDEHDLGGFRVQVSFLVGR